VVIAAVQAVATAAAVIVAVQAAATVVAAVTANQDTKKVGSKQSATCRLLIYTP